MEQVVSWLCGITADLFQFSSWPWSHAAPWLKAAEGQSIRRGRSVEPSQTAVDEPRSVSMLDLKESCRADWKMLKVLRFSSKRQEVAVGLLFENLCFSEKSSSSVCWWFYVLWTVFSVDLTLALIFSNCSYSTLLILFVYILYCILHSLVGFALCLASASKTLLAAQRGFFFFF